MGVGERAEIFFCQFWPEEKTVREFKRLNEIAKER